MAAATVQDFGHICTWGISLPRLGMTLKRSSLPALQSSRGQSPASSINEIFDHYPLWGGRRKGGSRFLASFLNAVDHLCPAGGFDWPNSDRETIFGHRLWPCMDLTTKQPNQAILTSNTVMRGIFNWQKDSFDIRFKEHLSNSLIN